MTGIKEWKRKKEKSDKEEKARTSHEKASGAKAFPSTGRAQVAGFR